MRRLAAPIVAIAAGVLAQALRPDRATWHEGWYSVALLALAVYLAIGVRAEIQRSTARRVAAVWIAAAGTWILAFAGIASGLLAPDPQLVVGAPGTPVAVAGLGNIVFPPLHDPSSPALETPNGVVLPIGEQRYASQFVLRSVARTVVAVDAYDSGGAHLTITQPTGPAFSSPVLLMDHTQRISGLDLPFDSFSVPVAHRIVKVVLFTADQVALMHGIAGPPQPVVLFAVDDDTDRPLPHAIRMARSGESVAVGGIRIRPTIASYPAVDVLSAPSLLALVVGFVLVAGGAALGIRTRSRSKT